MKSPRTLDEAHELIQEAMKDVIQELIVIDNKGEHHMIYVHGIEYNNGKIAIDYSTPSDYDYVFPYVQDAIRLQIEEHAANTINASIWERIKRFLKGDV